MRQFPQQAFRRIPRAKHQHWLTLKNHAAIKQLIAPSPVGEAAAAHQQDQQDRMQHQHRARHPRQREHQHTGGHQQRRQGHGKNDAAQIHQAGIAPDTAIQTKKVIAQRVDDHNRGQHFRHVEKENRRNFQIETQPIGDQPADHHGAEVVRNNQDFLVQSDRGHGKRSQRGKVNANPLLHIIPGNG